MLIKALCDYYDILAKQGLALPDGYSNVSVHYLVCLTPEGKIDDIVNIQELVQNVDKKGKTTEKYVPKVINMIERVQTTKIESSIIDHRPLYIFGLNYVDGKLSTIDSKDKAKKSHENFLEKNKEFIEGIDTPVVNAYRNFIENWKPEQEIENKFLLSIGKAYLTSNFIFCLTGHLDELLHDDDEINKKWKNEISRSSSKESKSLAQCAITGEISSIEPIHNKIKGLLGGSAFGNSLICFNNSSENSYGYEQSYNSNISTGVMKKYTEALNYLVKDIKHRNIIDDVTVLHWAMSDASTYDDMFSYLMFGNEEKMNKDEVEALLKNMMKDATIGNVTAPRLDVISEIKEDVEFYLVGLKPNASRIAVKFIYKRKFGEILKNIAVHQEDLRISKDVKPIALWQIKKELLSPNSQNENVNPALLSKIFQSIIYGCNYPEFLLSTIVRRVKTDTALTVNPIRVGIIKAYINRKSRLNGKKEEIKLALDRENNNTAYLCGRLFAVLEKIQQNASNNQLNRTIKDAYFSSACAKPAIIFPKLLKLAQNHLNKVSSSGYYNKFIGEILDMLNGSFPDNLYLVDQGKFIIGYYQQREDFYIKNSDKKEEI